jgi:hypothetical protein
LVDLVEALRLARRREQVVEIIDRLEDHYDAFDGPGQGIVENLLRQARQRLEQLP